MARSNYIVADEFGIDPLKNILDESLERLPVARTHTVVQSEIGHAGLISYKYYHSYDFDFAILKYNGILNEFDLKEGQVINIPNLQYVKTTAKKPKKKTFKKEVSI